MEVSRFRTGPRHQQLSASSVMQASTVLKAFLRWVHETDARPRRVREALETRDNRALPEGRLITAKELDLRKKHKVL